MTSYTQQHRHARISTVLGDDALLLAAMHGSEGMSQLFSFELSLISERQEITFDRIIGTAVTVSLDLNSGGKRFFNGIISSFSEVSGEETVVANTRFYSYRATMVPRFWLLGRSAELRIYQNMSVPEIVENILREHSLTDFEMKLLGSYHKRE